MKAIQLILCFGVLAAACAASLEPQAKEQGLQEAEKENYLRRAAIDSWLENNQQSEPAVLRQRLENLVDVVVARKGKFTVNEEDVGDVDGDVSEYGLGKKLKKWKNKVKKVLGDAAKAVIVNKVVGSLG